MSPAPFAAHCLDGPDQVICEAIDDIPADEPPARAGAVDRAAKARLRALVDAHFDTVWRSLRRLCVAESELDDCTQQVFLVASKKLAHIEEGSERAFLLSAAVHVASHARRALHRRREVPEDDTSARLDPTPQPDELVEQKQLRGVLDAVLAAMPEDLRTVLVLFELEEVPTLEIAAMLEIPPGTVASRLRRAREEFDRQLARHGGRR